MIQRLRRPSQLPLHRHPSKRLESQQHQPSQFPLPLPVAEAVEVGGEIGSPEVLGRYEAERRAENVGMAAALDGLKRVFAWQSAPLALARNLGLAAVNGAGPVKDLIMRYAMGSGSLRA